MIPKKLSIENFMGYKNAEINCSDIDLALILGQKNNDPSISNGVGKTTLYHAIRYALFNTPPNEMTLVDLVRIGTKAAKVSYEFELPDAGLYKIERSVSISKKSNLELYEFKSDWESISERSPSATDRKLAELIKVSEKAFSYSILFNQKDLTGLSEPDKSGKGARLKVLEEPLNVVKYSKIKELGDKKLQPLKKEIAQLESAIETLGNPKEDIKQAEDELKYCKAVIAEKEAQSEGIQSSIKEKQAIIDDIKSSLSSDDSNTHSTISQLEDRISKLESFINKLESNISQNEADLKHKQDKIKKLNSDIEKYNDQKYELTKNTHRSKDVISKQIEKVSNDEMYGSNLLSKLKTEYDLKNKTIPNDDFCSSCKQPITKEYREKFEKEVRTALEQKKNEIDNTQKNLNKCIRKKKKLQAELNEASKYEKELIEIENNIKHAKHKIETYTESAEKLPEKIAKDKNELNTYKSEYQEVSSRLKSLRESVQNDNTNEQNKKIYALTEEVKTAERSKKSIHNEIATMQSKIGGANERIKLANKNLEQIKDSKSKLSRARWELSTKQLALSAFADIPKFIVNTVLNELQLESNKILGEMRPELGLQIQEDLNITYTYNGQLRKYEMLSVGQQVYIAFALKLGLSKVIQNQLGINLGFLLWDEVDQSLDESGISAYIDIFKTWKDRFKIFIVSHNKRVQEAIQTRIIVNGDDVEGSTVEVLEAA